MRKRVIATGVLAGALAVSAAMSAMAAQITADKAKETALQHAGVKAEDVAYIKAKLDRENGKKVYDVEFLTKDYREYDYELDAENGKILQYDYEAERSFYADIPEKDRKADVTLEQAKKIALQHAGVKAENVTFVKAEADRDDGRKSYDVEFYTKDGNGWKEYDYEISAYTGEVLSYDADAESYGKASGSSQTAGLSAEDAKKKAFDKAGLKESDVSYVNLEQDYDDGRSVYEGSFRSGRNEYEFEIDAATGNFLSWESDIEDDFDDYDD